MRTSHWDITSNYRYRTEYFKLVSLLYPEMEGNEVTFNNV